MADMTLTIGGYSYTISCPEGQEQRVLDLANYVDMRVDEIKTSGAANGQSHPLALAALMIADEAMDAKQECDELRKTANTQPEDQTQEINSLVEIAGQINSISNRLKSV